MKAMNLAIKKHMAEHRKRNDDSKKLGALELFLIEGVLRASSELNLANSSGRNLEHSAVNRKPKFSKRTKSQQWTT